MMVPVQAWFRKPMRKIAREHLLGRRARQRGIINQKLVKQWVDYEESALPRHGVKLWLLLTLELWFRTYLDQPR
jgi:asparagine synthase (glutamine-hydrolysing)